MIGLSETAEQRFLKASNRISLLQLRIYYDFSDNNVILTFAQLRVGFPRVRPKY